jgi:hypothetical protein
MLPPERRRGVDPPARGTCFGFDVRSALDFAYLRDGPGEEQLTVLEDETERWTPEGPPDLEWSPRPDHPFHARLWSRGGRYHLWIGGTGWFQVDPGAATVTVPRSAPGDVRREARLWGVPAALCFVRRGDLPLHAATVDVDGSAVAFAAPGRFGKTTMAAAFLSAGHRVLSEDLTCCRLGPSPQVIPGPAALRLRVDSSEHFDLPHAEVLARDPDRLHLTMRGPLRGSGAPVPLRAVVFLRKVGYATSPRLTSIGETIRDLWSVSFNLPEESDRIRCLDGITRLMREVPVWEFSRPAGFDQMAGAVDTIISTCLQRS